MTRRKTTLQDAKHDCTQAKVSGSLGSGSPGATLEGATSPRHAGREPDGLSRTHALAKVYGMGAIA